MPPSLIFLKWLVIVLMITMIGGVITIVGLLVTRMPDGTGPMLPENVALPGDAVATAVTVTQDSVIVVTEDGLILVFGRDGSLRQELRLSD